MASWNPRAGRKPYKAKPDRQTQIMTELRDLAASLKAQATAAVEGKPWQAEGPGDPNIYEHKKGYTQLFPDGSGLQWDGDTWQPVPAPVVSVHKGPMSYPDLRFWLLAMTEEIGDQLPDLSQWRRIREEVGRSLPEKKTANWSIEETQAHGLRAKSLNADAMIPTLTTAVKGIKARLCNND
jgi:hypothetical protein